MKKEKFKPILFGLLGSFLYFIIFGGVSAVIRNPLFIRFVPITYVDWFILILSSILIGFYVGLFYYLKNNNLTSCNVYASGGGFFSFLAFACPVCNKVLVLVLGASGVMTYFDPIRPFLGFVGISLLMYANYILIKNLVGSNNRLRYKGGNYKK